MSSQHILIIGAGVCGLAIAHGLRQASIPFTIFESEEETTFRPREWTMALHWGLPMLEELLPKHLADRLPADSVPDPSLNYSQYPNNATSVYDGPSGKKIRDITSDGKFLRVSRRKLRALCGEGIDVQYGFTLERVEYGDAGTVTAIFKSGERRTGTLLVGADGPRSCVRECLCPGKALATALPMLYVNVAFSYNNAEKAKFVRSANPVCSFVVHPDCIAMVSIQDVPDPADPQHWRFQLVISWTGEREDEAMSNEESHTLVKSHAVNLPEPFRSAILWIPDNVDIRFYDLSYWVPERWNTQNGGVVLAGDAAHSMPPNRGQGLNHAINDAYNVVAAIKQIDRREVQKQAVIEAYRDEVVVRGAKETQLSRDTAFATLDYDKFKDSGIMKHGLARSPEDE